MKNPTLELSKVGFSCLSVRLFYNYLGLVIFHTLQTHTDYTGEYGSCQYPFSSIT